MFRGYICVKMWFIPVAVCYILLCWTLSIQLISFKAHSHIFFPWSIYVYNYIVYIELILTQSPINQEFIFWYMSFNFNHEEPNCNWSNWQVGSFLEQKAENGYLSHIFFLIRNLFFNIFVLILIVGSQTVIDEVGKCVPFSEKAWNSIIFRHCLLYLSLDLNKKYIEEELDIVAMDIFARNKSFCYRLGKTW